MSELPIIVPALIAGLFGLLVGSFANVCIYRIPLDQSIVFPASRCPRCLSPIAPWQNLPVLSWLLLTGRCGSCRLPISPRYPIVEAIHGAGFGAIVWTFGLNPFTPVICIFFTSLVVLALIDWDHQLLPDVITIPGVALGVVSTFLPGAFISWKESALAALLGFLSFFLVAKSYSKMRGIEGLGMGDWKLAAMMGSFLGGRALLLIVFLGSLSGMAYGLVQALRLRGAAVVESEIPSGDDDPSIGKYRLPFGTFLAAAAILVLFRGEAVLYWYSSFFPA